MCVCIRRCVYVYVYVYMYMCVCTYVCMCVCVYVYMCMYICVYVHMQVLTVNNVFDILCKFVSTRDWRQALRSCVHVWACQVNVGLLA